MRYGMLAAALLVAGCSDAGCERPAQSFSADIVDVPAAAPAPAGASSGFKAAPDGDPRLLAARSIERAEHPCGRLAGAKRLADGSIAATCSNGEDYRITSIDAVGTVAMRCSAVRRMGIGGC